MGRSREQKSRGGRLAYCAKQLQSVLTVVGPCVEAGDIKPDILDALGDLRDQCMDAAYPLNPKVHAEMEQELRA